MWTKLPGWCRRRMARWLSRRTCRIKAEPPIISFTFDDFPKSALFRGGAILREHGLFGTYYVSCGLMGQNGPTGEIFSHEDLGECVRQKHELGCHTFNHCHAWDTKPAEFEASILRNQQALGPELTGSKLTSLSYPISYPRPATKRRVARYYDCARGGGQAFNAGITDSMYLKSFFIEQSRDDLGAIKSMIDSNSRGSGWLIFATHDISETPTRFGCTPRLFEQVVEYSARSGATVLPVGQAWQRINPKPPVAHL